MYILGILIGLIVPASADNKAGEEINWRVISGGGSINGASANYLLGGTIDQTAVGPGTSASYRLHNGFWQDFGVTSCCDLPGDANNDGKVNVGDAVFVINYVFRSGPVPVCLQKADANADTKVNVGDAVYIVNYVFRAGPAPVCGP